MAGLHTAQKSDVVKLENRTALWALWSSVKCVYSSCTFFRQGNKAWTVTLGQDNFEGQSKDRGINTRQLETMRHRTQAEVTTGKKKGKHNVHRSN